MLYKYNYYPIMLVIAIYRQWRNSLQHVSNFVSTLLLSMATGKDIDHLNVFFLLLFSFMSLTNDTNFYAFSRSFLLRDTR